MEKSGENVIVLRDCDLIKRGTGRVSSESKSMPIICNHVDFFWPVSVLCVHHPARAREKPFLFFETKSVFLGTHQSAILRSTSKVLVCGSQLWTVAAAASRRVREVPGEVSHSHCSMHGHAEASAQAICVASNRRCPAAVAMRVCLVAVQLAITASSSSPLGDRPARVPLAWIGCPSAARLWLPGVAIRGPGQAMPALCMVTRGSPAKGEIRNPWGRAGKPENRIIRQQEAEQVAELRAQAWSHALRHNGKKGKKDDEDVNAKGVDVSITEDIKDFHERSSTMLRECGGRMNSLTFTYKWEQRYGESLITFLSRQRLTVAEMLKQSNAFWVVDMPGDHDGAGPMQIYILNEKKLIKENTRETLGDQVLGPISFCCARPCKKRVCAAMCNM